MDQSYKDSVPSIDFTRNLEEMEFFDFAGTDEKRMQEFLEDIEGNNDSIELHLVRTKAYKEALILTLPMSSHPEMWKQFLREEQKTFGGSKIFYLNTDSTRILVLAVKNEIMNKLNMAITRINKVNEKIHRYNAAVKKENLELYESRARGRMALSKKDEVIHFLNQHLKA